jgi:ABC-2 type transport system ATP-binding protein
MTSLMIDAQDLVKKFAQKKTNNGNNGSASKKFKLPFSKRPPKQWLTAVDGVSLKIPQGEVFGLLGPNGAGKTTTIRMLCTLLEPTSGTALINGYDIQKQASRVRQSLGTVLAGDRSIYWKMTGRENLEYFAALYHIQPKIAKQRINELLERMELVGRADELVEKYSTGMKQRIAISKALIARPPILLLDEPTLGLDPQAARMVRELIAILRDEGHTVLLTTHYMEEADQLSDRIGIIDNGKIIALDTPDTLKNKIDQRDLIHLEVAGWEEMMGDKIKNLSGVSSFLTRYTGADSLWEINIQAENSRQIIPTLVSHLNSNGTHLVNMNIVKPSLEDVFIHLTGKALRD